MIESDILYQNGDYWVRRVATGYEVYCDGPTHATRCARIGYKGVDGLRRAKAEADKRASRCPCGCGSDQHHQEY